MSPLASLAQALGVAYASGINLYATVALLGLAQRYDWVGPLPGSLAAVGNWWVIGIAGALYLFEFVATLVPGVASAWETFHSVIRPPAAAALAVATAWHGDALFVLVAALLGGGLALTTHTTKLGLRYAIDTSPEPLTNGAANLAELGLVASVTYAIWQHPFVTLAVALLILLALMIVVRLIWRALRRVFRGNWMPKPGLMQSPRCSTPRVNAAVRSMDDRIVD
ncbi:MAG: DUF4126 domain-containing protein [Gemmatimonadaceae bacterium]